VAIYVTNEPDIVRALKKIGKPDLLGPTQETQTRFINEGLGKAKKLLGPDPVLDET
jgi:hypothetical protein